MDFTTIIGTIAGISLVISAIVSGDDGGLAIFLNLPSFLLVIGGTMAATTIAFPSHELFTLPSVTRRLFSNPKAEVNTIISFITECQQRSRVKGHLALEVMVKKAKWNSLRKGLQLIADGADNQTLSEILTIEQRAIEEHHRVGQKIFSEMAKYAPAFGMIGTLVGLVKMLAFLNDPDSIGPKMALALLTTLYGVLLANLIFTPMVTKLERRCKIEVLQIKLMIVGLKSINKSESLLITREKMGAFLAHVAIGTAVDRRKSRNVRIKNERRSRIR
jgi:chemotaxis protein MotA